MNLLMKGAALAPPFSCTTKYSSDVYSPRPPDIRVRLLPTKPPVHFTTEQPGRDTRYSPLFFVRQVISYCLNAIEGESGYFNCGGNNQGLLLHHCPVGINDWSHVSVGNETQYEAVMSRIQGLSIGIVIVTTILLFLRVVLVLYISGAG